MPDEWGRPTFADGAQVAQGLMSIQQWNQQQQDRATNQAAYSAADAIANKGDLSGFTPEAKYKGAKLYFDNRFNEMRAKTQENLQSTAAMNQKIQRLNLNLQTANQRLASYRAARSAGDDALAKKIAIQLNNENMYSGRYVEPGQDGYEITEWNGQKSKIKDMPIQQVDQIIGSYFNRPPDEIMKWQMTAEQMRSQKNAEIISQAEPYYNQKTGRIIYKIPNGTWGPDGKPRGSFFVDDPGAQQELPAEATKGYVPMKIAQGQQALNKKDIVKPTNIVTGMGPEGNQQQGLVVMGQGGSPQFQQIQGAPQHLGGGQVKPSEQKSAYELKIKQLNTQLMPFNSSEAPIFERTPDGNYQLSEGGHNALMAAMKLVQRANANSTALSPQEMQLLDSARQAVEMYQSMSDENAQAFGLNPSTSQTSGQPSNQNIPSIPSGFQPLNFSIGP